MKQNNWVYSDTPITEYEVDSKGIRRIPSKKRRKSPPDWYKRARKKRNKSENAPCFPFGRWQRRSVCVRHSFTSLPRPSLSAHTRLKPPICTP